MKGLQNSNSEFIIGELYLFHQSNSQCPAESSLWGIYDHAEEESVYLESSSLDLHNYKLWHRLPDTYCHYRLATRAELRDYMYGLGVSDIRRTLTHNKIEQVSQPQ